MARKHILNQDGTPNWDTIAGFKERLDGHDISVASNTSSLATKAPKRRIDLVDDFKADYTGLTGTSTAIQNAINSIPDGEAGAIITYPANSLFKLDATINIINKHNIRFEPIGSGYMGSSFQGITPNMLLFNIQSHGVSFSRSRLTGDTTMTGIVIGDGVNTTFDEFRFEEDSVCANLGIGIQSKMRNWWIRDALFSYCNIGIQIDGYTNSIDNGQDYHIINNRFHGCQQYGVLGNGYAKDVIIEGNKIDDGKHGIVFSNGLDLANIINNIISQSTGDGIKVIQTQGGKDFVDISHNTIYGDGTTNDTGNGIWFNGNLAKMNDNIIYRKNQHGIYAESMAYGNIESNIIQACSTQAAGYYGIYVKAGSNMIIDKNTSRQSGGLQTYGIYIEDAVGMFIMGENIGEGSTGDIRYGASSARGVLTASVSSFPRTIYSDTLPTSGSFRAGDEVRKRTVTQAGSAGSQYVSIGWKRITTGTNNVLNTDWVEMRSLTGN